MVTAHPGDVKLRTRSEDRNDKEFKTNAKSSSEKSFQMLDLDEFVERYDLPEGKKEFETDETAPLVELHGTTFDPNDLTNVLVEHVTELASDPPMETGVVAVIDMSETDVEIEAEVHWRGVSSLVYRQRRTEALLAIGEVVREHGASFAVWDAVLNKAGFLEGPRNNNGATELDTSPSYIQS